MGKGGIHITEELVVEYVCPAGKCHDVSPSQSAGVSAFISIVTFSFFSSLQKIVSPVKTGISAAAVIELVVEFKVHVGKSVSCHYLGFSFISGSVPDGDGWGRKRVNP